MKDHRSAEIDTLMGGRGARNLRRTGPYLMPGDAAQDLVPADPYTDQPATTVAETLNSE